MGNQQLICGRFANVPEVEGETRPLRNAGFPLDQDLLGDFRGMTNLKQILDKNAKEVPQKPFLGTRAHKINEKGEIEYGEYQWKTYGQVYEDSQALARFLLAKDLCPKNKFEEYENEFRMVALYSKNREEWAISDFACLQTAITTVTLYDTLGKESIEYILDQCMIKTVICQADKVKNILNLKQEGQIQSVTHIIYFQEIKPVELNAEEALSQSGITLIKFEDAIAEGKSLQGIEFEPVDAETFYTFSYTSGTTGMPKGVMITHRNYACNIGGINQFDPSLNLYDTDVYLSYLPLAHVIERLLFLTSMANKIQYGFFQGDVMKLKDDLAVLKPTVFASVPRLYNRFYDLMQQKINEVTGMKRKLINRAVAVKLSNLEKTADVTHMLYDSLVFNKFKEILGGRVRVMVSGSAPISKEVLSFLKIAFCAPILEAYGQTESAAPATATWIKDPTVGHVGAPFPSTSLKLVDVPEMNYTSKDKDEAGNSQPRGEICYKGYSSFKGYFRQLEQTRDTIDQDGWVHTGDIGTILSNGTVKIIDRKKNIFKLSQGEYIAPDKIEGKVAQSMYIAQIFVYGDSLQSNVVAIIVPDKPMIEKWATENGAAGATYEETLANPKTQEFMTAEVKTKCKEGGFFGFEIPQKIYLTAEQWTVENDLLTPTFKLKRNEAKKHYYKEIKAMYAGAKLQGEE